MLTVDLQKELTAKKNKPPTLQEIDTENLLKQAEEILEKANQEGIEEGLSALGFTKKIEEVRGDLKKCRNLKIARVTFGHDKVFTKDEIKGVCVKYRLRFLPTKLYKGEVDLTATRKIESMRSDLRRFCGVKPSDFFIAAPASSFELTKVPRDPLLFCHLGHDVYVLIHKWGNDLSLFRALPRYLLDFVAPLMFVAFVIIGGVLGFDGTRTFVHEYYGSKPDLADHVMRWILTLLCGGLGFLVALLCCVPLMVMRYEEDLWDQPIEH